MDGVMKTCYKLVIFWAGRKALVHPRAGTFPRHFIFRRSMAELSVFIDESL